jgi:hypothetical protein
MVETGRVRHNPGQDSAHTPERLAKLGGADLLPVTALFTAGYPSPYANCRSTRTSFS